jgi:hypothetical protein
MKRNILLASTILLVNSAIVRVSGQISISEPFIKETVQQSRSFGQEWQNDRKNSFQYDIHGNEILNQLSIWNQESLNWTITNEEFTQYDRERNRTMIHQINYIEYPEKQIERKEVREYDKGLVTYRNIAIQNYETSFSDSIRVFDVFYKYNENGDRTEFTVHYTRNNEFQGGYGFRWYFNENFCEVALLDYNIDLNGTEIISDSTATSRDSWCNITQESKYDFSFSYYDLYSDRLFEYEYDAKGNVLVLAQFQRTKSYEEWEKLLTQNITYNNADMQTSIQEFNFLSGREKLQRLEYDNQDRLILHSEEIKESPESDWVQDSYFQWSYNEYDQLEMVEINLDWNPTGKIFNNTRITEYIYDNDGNNIQTISDRTLNGERTTKVEIREYRCDGVEISNTLTTRNFIDGGIILNQDAIHTSYFQRAPCQSLESVSVNFVIYPNPTENYFRIYNEDAFGDSILKIINSKGDLVKELKGQLDNYLSMDATALEPGLYIIQIETEAGKFSQKFIKK